MSSHYVTAAGTIDKVRAIRYKDDVQYLIATLHVTHRELKSQYGSSDVTEAIEVIVPADSPVNPGDLAVLSLSFDSPAGRRFMPALEMNSDGEDKEDADDS